MFAMPVCVSYSHDPPSQRFTDPSIRYPGDREAGDAPAFAMKVAGEGGGFQPYGGQDSVGNAGSRRSISASCYPE